MLSRFPHPRPYALAAVLSLAAFVTGCGDSSDGAPPAPAATSSEVTVPVSAVTTTVSEAGSEPREVVRIAPVARQEQNVVLTTRSEVFQQIGSEPRQDFSTPEVTLPLTATVTQAVSDSAPSTLVDITVGEATSPDPMLGSSLADATGSRAGLTIGPTGAISALRLAPSVETANIARSAIEQAFYQSVYRTISFPDSEIGVGAVWQIHQQVMSAGVTIDQRSTATLVSRDGDRLTVDVRVEQTPRESVWMLPNGQGQLDIEQYTMAGEGAVTFDPALPLPVDGALVLSGDQVYVDPEGTTRLAQSQVDRVEWHSPEN
ncbi:lipoprotein [Rhodococcus coprophilus]|uniref:Lipoprotein n=1 Tax=Rhodococcus coprophilus TaxID=38310 RepID=A0A2X4TPQ6_9NOCA|nr:lipoprotein [Rhodococcus coprophilus]